LRFLKIFLFLSLKDFFGKDRADIWSENGFYAQFYLISISMKNVKINTIFGKVSSEVHDAQQRLDAAKSAAAKLKQAEDAKKLRSQLVAVLVILRCE
jgi:hypothetical protein